MNGIWRLLIPPALLAGAACASVEVPGPGHPYYVPVDELSPAHREKVLKVLADPTVMVELERTPVESRPEVYAFLLEELPFAADVCRELGQANYVITRDEKGGFVLDDGEGLRLRAELVRREDRRWIYYTYGNYALGLFRVVGRSVIIVRFESDENILRTEARVYAKVENKVLEAGALAMGDAVTETIRRKSFVFVSAARTVAEMAARDPRALVEAVGGSRHVDPATLAEFRRRFVP